MSGEVLEALLWSAFGFTAGWVSCYLAQRVVDADEEGSENMPTKRTNVDKTRTILGILILLMVTVSAVQYYRATDCQTNYNAQVADSLIQRSDAQRIETQAEIEKAMAQKEFLNSLSQDRTLATQRYLASLDKQIEAARALESVRRAHPLPVVPRCSLFQ